MRQRLVRYLRSIGFSAATLGLALCLPLAHAQSLSQKPELRPEPRIGEAPAAGATAPEPVSEADLLAAAEDQLAAVEADLSNIRKAMDLLGPLPNHPDLFIPQFVEVSSLDATPARDISRLYAVAPKFERASSLFHQAELGSFASEQAAASHWRMLTEANRLAGLAPAYAEVGGEVRLTAGPLASENEVQALCVELAALAGPCRVVAPVRAW